MPQNTRFEKPVGPELRKVAVIATPNGYGGALPVSHPSEAHKSALDVVPHKGSPFLSHVPFPGLDLAQSNWDNLIGLVVTSYIPENELPFIWDNCDNTRSRICGFWVEVLPNLASQAHQNCILPSAMKALATSILASTPGRNHSKFDSTEHYYAAIRALRIEIAAKNPASHAEFAASIMCLSLTEVFLFHHIL